MLFVLNEQVDYLNKGIRENAKAPVVIFYKIVALIKL